uniref:Uncharacterized protein n=1 Tax=Arundo donax TaxID=35708 RepID=A0A0A9AG25_ARUDO
MCRTRRRRRRSGGETPM